MTQRYQALLCLSVLSFCSIVRGQQPNPDKQSVSRDRAEKSTAQNGPARKNAPTQNNVCSLLTPAEVQSAQGEAVEEIKPGTQTSGGLVLSQCVFRTSTPSKSVSLALASGAAGDTSQAVQEFWRKHFHRNADQRHEHGASDKATSSVQGKAEDEEESDARPIAGLGQEAYWVSGPISSALYVLQGNNFLRVSVGGFRDGNERLQKSQTLARAALKRMK